MIYYKRPWFMKPTSIILLTITLTILSVISPFYYTVAQPTNSTLPLKSNQVNLAVSNITLGYSPTGLIAVNGIILNNSTDNVENIKVDVTLYDANNITISETTRFISSAFYTYEPGSSENFSFLMGTENFQYYTARAYGDRIN
jgi:hypothetical protein